MPAANRYKQVARSNAVYVYVVFVVPPGLVSSGDCASAPLRRTLIELRGRIAAALRHHRQDRIEQDMTPSFMVPPDWLPWRLCLALDVAETASCGRAPEPVCGRGAAADVRQDENRRTLGNLFSSFLSFFSSPMGRGRSHAMQRPCVFLLSATAAALEA